jgi:cytoplasmic iron level regulating protein YaaA (DUF328/UPF0246 family)
MISIISPAKSMNFSSGNLSQDSSSLKESEKTGKILEELKSCSKEDIKKMMSVSDKIAQLNYERYQHYKNLDSKQALFAYDGDVYNNMDKEKMTADMLDFAQSHVRIISGLYGLLKPLDRIRPYRLEMSVKLPGLAPDGLDRYWKEDITKQINEELSGHEYKFLINVASKEYSSAICRKSLQFPMIDIHFLETRNGELKNIAINSKRARGMIAGYIIKHKIDNPENLKQFEEFGYVFNQKKSTENAYYFIKS